MDIRPASWPRPWAWRPAQSSYRGRLLAAVAMAAAALGIVLYTHNVPTRLTADDRQYIPLILRDGGHAELLSAKPQTYGDQVEAIAAVQDAVLRVAPDQAGIPLEHAREPRDLYTYRGGLCYDRSRTIEKTLTWLGFMVRHISIYALDRRFGVAALVERGDPSHAVTEVWTEHGWLVVDSNRRWISLDASGRPVNIATLAKWHHAASWSTRNADAEDAIFDRRFTYVIGLYSRHGRFYPPYDSLPDVNWPALAWNLF